MPRVAAPKPRAAGHATYLYIDAGSACAYNIDYGCFYLFSNAATGRRLGNEPLIAAEIYCFIDTMRAFSLY